MLDWLKNKLIRRDALTKAKELEAAAEEMDQFDPAKEDKRFVKTAKTARKSLTKIKKIR
ncbi:MAG: hypothetical protein ABH879_05930 [archaeon]